MTDPKANLPKEKQTALGLYVTAKEAYEKWKAEPEKVKIFDVRTPEEYLFVGHAEMARNIPIGFVTYQWNADKNEPGSTCHGKLKNGWKNSGSPWTYEVNPELLWICTQ